MIQILDKYILKRYFITFFTMIGMFIPIGIIIEVSEKIHKILENEVPASEIIEYFLCFIVYFSNLLFPIFLFLSVIWFTSKLAMNTEIVAFLSSGVSFNRFLKPYFIGATVISLFALLMGFFVVPKASEIFNAFRYKYYHNNRGDGSNETDVYRQIAKDEYLYVNSFNKEAQMAFNFSYEKFKDKKLEYKIAASRIKFNEKDTTYTLYDYKKRTVGLDNDKIEVLPEKTMKFNFDLEDLAPVIYIAETMSLPDLLRFIAKEEDRGNANLKIYKTSLYKKISTPVSAFILTIIAVSVSSIKRRGGMGVNLAIGIVLGFIFVFFDKVFVILAEKSSIPTLLSVWIPNIMFGILAYYLLKNAKR
jgi:lipopolysaccharide export system permease protein